MTKQRRRTQAWLLVGYSLAILTMSGMDHGSWRHVVMGLAVSVLITVVFLMTRLRYGSRPVCSGNGQSTIV